MRALTLSHEHTTIAIRRAEGGTDPGVTVIVQDSGIDLGAVERALIQFALESHGGNRTHAAEFLGLSRSALLYRMHKYGLAAPLVSPASTGEHS